MHSFFKRLTRGTTEKIESRVVDFDIEGRTIALHLKRHGRARRITLKYNAAAADFSLTLPPSASETTALKFAETQRKWISKQLAQAVTPVSFMPGVSIPVRGVDHLINQTDAGRGTVWTDNSNPQQTMLWVKGAPEHIPRRITDWLKREARSDLNARVHQHANDLGLEFKSVSVRDQKSRWGSCSSTKTLSFSWRLIMAPEHVLDYVAAHEVAHLAHMNHGPDFWALVETAIPDMAVAKKWLKANGTGLHRYGA